jgi:hypothetical protein
VDVRILEERLLAKRIIGYGPDPCWLWDAGRDQKGYGSIWIDGGARRVHRVAWLIWWGPIPDGAWVLHRCDNPPCFNPRHLWLGGNTDNQRDSSLKGRTRNGNFYKTHCPQGHAYEETDYGYEAGRVCRICKRETARRWYYEHGGSAGRRARRATRLPEGSGGVASPAP